jgi:aminopeptidase N
MQWLTRPGAPKIEGSWRFDAAKKTVDVTLTQAQTAAPFRLSVDVGIVTKAGEPPRVETIELTGHQQTKSISVDAAPHAVTVDPNTWLLMEEGPWTRRP